MSKTAQKLIWSVAMGLFFLASYYCVKFLKPRDAITLETIYQPNIVSSDKTGSKYGPYDPKIRSLPGTNGAEDCRPTQQRTIYMLETSGATKLNHRQACSVESMAKANKDMEVKVLFQSKTFDFQDPYMQLLLLEENIKMLARGGNFSEIFSGTPLEQWYKGKRYEKCEFKVVHLSDALRLALLWKYGGIYSDIDIIAMRPMKDLHNVAVAEYIRNINNAFLVFDKSNPFLYTWMENFSKKYTCGRNANGPQLITSLYFKLCNIKTLEMVPEIDCGVKILPMKNGFAIPFIDSQLFYEEHKDKDVDFRLKDSYFAHLYDGSLKNHEAKVTVGKGTALESLMKNYCPTVYHLCISRNLTVL